MVNPATLVLVQKVIDRGSITVFAQQFNLCVAKANEHRVDAMYWLGLNIQDLKTIISITKDRDIEV